MTERHPRTHSHIASCDACAMRTAPASKPPTTSLPPTARMSNGGWKPPEHGETGADLFARWAEDKGLLSAIDGAKCRELAEAFLAGWTYGRAAEAVDHAVGDVLKTLLGGE